jgi:hypothetical protein
MRPRAVGVVAVTRRLDRPAAAAPGSLAKFAANRLDALAGRSVSLATDDGSLVARMERSGMRDHTRVLQRDPDFAALHPGYGRARRLSPPGPSPQSGCGTHDKMRADQQLKPQLLPSNMYR